MREKNKTKFEKETLPKFLHQMMMLLQQGSGKFMVGDEVCFEQGLLLIYELFYLKLLLMFDYPSFIAIRHFYFLANLGRHSSCGIPRLIFTRCKLGWHWTIQTPHRFDEKSFQYAEHQNIFGNSPEILILTNRYHLKHIYIYGDWTLWCNCFEVRYIIAIFLENFILKYVKIISEKKYDICRIQL